MINPITSAASIAQAKEASQPAAPTAHSKSAPLPQDTVSISPQAHAASANAGDVDHDGDSH